MPRGSGKARDSQEQTWVEREISASAAKLRIKAKLARARSNSHRLQSAVRVYSRVVLMSTEITDKVLDLIASTKRLPRERVSLNSTFEELGLDSLDAINLMFEVESEFNISVPDDVANSIKNVPQMIEELKKLLAENSGSQSGQPE
jgi:acyl carrier protein